MKFITIILGLLLYEFNCPYTLEAESQPIYRIVFIQQSKSKKKRDYTQGVIKTSRNIKRTKKHFKPNHQ